MRKDRGIKYALQSYGNDYYGYVQEHRSGRIEYSVRGQKVKCKFGDSESTERIVDLATLLDHERRLKEDNHCKFHVGKGNT
jgi:hypothetical protein